MINQIIYHIVYFTDLLKAESTERLPWRWKLECSLDRILASSNYVGEISHQVDILAESEHDFNELAYTVTYMNKNFIFYIIWIISLSWKHFYLKWIEIEYFEKLKLPKYELNVHNFFSEQQLKLKKLLHFISYIIRYKYYDLLPQKR